jgi:hypothetical protein
MAGYRLYFLDAANTIQARQDFAADSDAHAKTISGAVWLACAECYEDYELWQAARCLGRGNGHRHEISAPEREGGDAHLQARVLEIEELLLASHWRVARSEQLIAAAATLRRELDASDPAAISHHDVCATSAAKPAPRR